ncbi:MAG: hypothetical protein IT193_10125 [Propionibacteriaceae bacterium]|nr:hypothetical protein [Propionibacteriaceae bacterium]
MTTSPTSGQLWEQPTFDNSGARPYVTGPVLLPVVTQLEVPPPGLEEQRLTTIRALIWPLALVVGIVTGSWATFLLLPLVVGIICRNRLRELRRQRYASAQLLR